MREYLALFRFGLALFDMLLIACAGLAAFYFRFGHLVLTSSYWNVLLCSVLIGTVIFNFFGFYRPMREKRFLAYLFDGTLAILLLLACLSVVGLMTKQNIIYSRLWLSYWLLFFWLSFVLSRSVLYATLYLLRKQGYNTKRVIVLGINERAQTLVETMRQSLWAGIKVLRYFADEAHFQREINGVRVWHLPENIAAYVRRSRVDEVWIVLPLTQESLIQRVAQQLISEKITVRYVPDLLGISIHKHTLSEISGYPLINLYSSPLEGGRYWLKLTEDLLCSSILLLLASPVMIVIALLIKLTSRGPVLFKQMRHGRNGKPINVYKFRSMYEHQERKGVVTQAKAKDSRITPMGRFLRKSSLDELPQLINVLQGRMSLVGPRPHAIEHNEYYKDLVDSYMQRFRMKPGITGWAQINGYRGETDTLDKMQKRVEYDIYYIENWGLLFDLRIIALTFFKVMFDKQAY